MQQSVKYGQIHIQKINIYLINRMWRKNRVEVLSETSLHRVEEMSEVSMLTS